MVLCIIGLLVLYFTGNNDMSPNICGKTCPSWAEIAVMKAQDPVRIERYLAWDDQMKAQNFKARMLFAGFLLSYFGLIANYFYYGKGRKLFMPKEQVNPISVPKG